MSLDMRLLSVSDGTVVSDKSEYKAVGLSDPLVSNGATGPAKTDAYVAPNSGGPCCLLQAAANSTVTADAFAGIGADPSLSAGCLFAGSDESSELASLLALRLPTSCLDGRWGLRSFPSRVTVAACRHN